MCFTLLMIAIVLTQTRFETSAAGNRMFDQSSPQTPRASRFDSYGETTSNEEKARLDYFASHLQQELRSTGYIIAYGRRTRPGEAKKRADRAKHYLWYNRSIETKRVESLDHCFSTKLEVELWIVPSGASAPSCKNRSGPVRSSKKR